MEGLGPKIEVLNESTEGSGTLYLAREMLNTFENSTGLEETAALTWIVSTILHEDLEQYTDDNLLDGTGCQPMEIEIYGLNILDLDGGINAITNRLGLTMDIKGKKIFDPTVIPTLPEDKYQKPTEQDLNTAKKHFQNEKQ